jgi:hypothetical protein
VLEIFTVLFVLSSFVFCFLSSVVDIFRLPTRSARQALATRLALAPASRCGRSLASRQAAASEACPKTSTRCTIPCSSLLPPPFFKKKKIRRRHVFVGADEDGYSQYF